MKSYSVEMEHTSEQQHAVSSAKVSVDVRSLNLSGICLTIFHFQVVNSIWYSIGIHFSTRAIELPDGFSLLD